MHNDGSFSSEVTLTGVVLLPLPLFISHWLSNQSSFSLLLSSLEVCSHPWPTLSRPPRLLNVPHATSLLSPSVMASHLMPASARSFGVSSAQYLFFLPPDNGFLFLSPLTRPFLSPFLSLFLFLSLFFSLSLTLNLSLSFSFFSRNLFLNIPLPRTFPHPIHVSPTVATVQPHEWSLNLYRGHLSPHFS